LGAEAEGLTLATIKLRRGKMKNPFAETQQELKARRKRERETAQMESRVLNILKYGWAECCPNCQSRRIHKRKGFHLIAKYRCRKCHSTFREPRGLEA